MVNIPVGNLRGCAMGLGRERNCLCLDTESVLHNYSEESAGK